ncbi:flagellar basal body protein [Clostridium sp. D53t1_180928_C8]|uniref:flagellar basal body protein n=1 Tax=Clostridium sp. D53t1_180928_C8 TaxID=2787101 RepID=UPI0018AB9394|nr:flagellar basal body protein [Clostridium sp. D53t1_180928_C8]
MEIYNLIRNGLDAVDIRGNTIANNIANVNTPGYKRKYVSFEEALDRVNSKQNIEVKEDKSTSMRVDGNNVDLESEKVNQAANTLMYHSLVSITNLKLSMAKSVITGR